MRARALMLALTLSAGLSACGESSREAVLDVSAATSLKPALDHARFQHARVRLSFAGSDVLAAQIRAGARPDVYIAANSELPRALAREGLVQTPVPLARNELVLAVPRDGARVAGLADLGRDGVRIAIGARSVPVGAYADSVIDQLDAGLRRRVLANVRSREPDVAGIIGKLAHGAVDAGFVYRTDARAASPRIRAISFAARLQPRVVYEAAVVTGTDQPRAARAYVGDLVRGRGAQALRASGFRPP